MLALVPGKDKGLSFPQGWRKLPLVFGSTRPWKRNQLSLISQTADSSPLPPQSLSLSLSGDAGFLQVSWLTKETRADSRKILGREVRRKQEKEREKKNRKRVYNSLSESEREETGNYQMCDGVMTGDFWHSRCECLAWDVSCMDTEEVFEEQRSWGLQKWVRCGYLRGQENDQIRWEESKGERAKTAGGNYTGHFWTTEWGKWETY